MGVRNDGPIGVTRSLTEVFALLRGNAHQIQFSYSNPNYETGSSRNGDYFIIFIYLYFEYRRENEPGPIGGGLDRGR